MKGKEKKKKPRLNLDGEKGKMKGAKTLIIMTLALMILGISGSVEKKFTITLNGILYNVIIIR